ncbi:hypothetical protein FG05_35286 [Fusarium graminearum]|nr:hypothetical protein FG05_35286 [Fusarium graminearum]
MQPNDFGWSAWGLNLLTVRASKYNWSKHLPVSVVHVGTK